MTDLQDIYRDTCFTTGVNDRIHVEGEDNDFLGERCVNLTLDVGGEVVTALLDAHHLANLRRSLQRAERWIAKGEVQR